MAWRLLEVIVIAKDGASPELRRSRRAEAPEAAPMVFYAHPAHHSRPARRGGNLRGSFPAL
ncbi:hypothetical protein GCM10009861_08420 [Neomicrococcus aestuarii]